MHGAIIGDIVERIVKDIDDIVHVVRFDGGQAVIMGRKEFKKTLRIEKTFDKINDRSNI